MVSELARQDDYGYSDLGIPIAPQIEPPAVMDLGQADLRKFAMGALAQQRDYQPTDATGSDLWGHQTAAGMITPQDIDKATGMALSFSGGGLGIKAYHGSPHDFNAFDLSKIGSGEGAQAYGHGLYFAEHEPTAKFYRDSIVTKRPDLYAVGNDVVPAPDLMKQIQSTINAPTDYAPRSILRDISAGLSWDDIRKGNPGGHFQKAIDEAQRLGVTPKPYDAPAGHMYEVNINADPAQMLDWDKPLAQMSPEVQEKLAKAWLAHPEGHSRQSGAQIYEASRLVPGDYRDPVAASQKLSEAGIPGIKYLDEGSRFSQALYNDNPIANEARKFVEAAGGNSEKAGELFHKSNPVERWAVPERDEIRRLIQMAGNKPTSNYVVFNPSIIDIMRKYGIAGAAPAGLGALAAQDQYRNP
jgi:hypothetical protein